MKKSKGKGKKPFPAVESKPAGYGKGPKYKPQK